MAGATAPETKGNAIALARNRITTPCSDSRTRDHTSAPMWGCLKDRWATAKWAYEYGRGPHHYMDITRIDLMIANGEFFNTAST